MANPYISLLRTAWHYARGERKKYVLVYAMFAFENVIVAMNPILLGWFVGLIQRDTTRVFHYALLYGGCFVALKFLQWCLHGPARVMERVLAFNLSRNFLQER
jgi:ATP-binding cassette subfamily B protein